MKRIVLLITLAYLSVVGFTQTGKRPAPMNDGIETGSMAAAHIDSVRIHQMANEI